MNDRFQAIHEEPPRDLFGELHDLITARFSEQITLEQLKRLEYLILNDEQARQTYLLYVHDLANLRRMLRADAVNEKTAEARELDSLRESMLAWRLNSRAARGAGGRERASQAVAAQPSASDAVIRSHPAPARRRTWKAAGLALLLGGAIALMVLLRPAPAPTPTPDLAPQAVLTETLDAVWEDDQGVSVTIPSGEPLGPCRLRLVRGVATIAVGTETVILLDGRGAATSFEIKADGGGQLHFGRLTLRSKPASTTHYEIGLPGNVRLVHGTEFGVVVDEDGRSEVHVIAGVVDAMRLGDDGVVSARTKITPHTAVAVRPASPQAPIEIAASSFDRGQFLVQSPNQTLEQTTRASESAQHSAWKKYAGALRQDPALVYYFDGAASGAGADRLAAGRFGEKSAVSFAKAGDQIVVADERSLRLEEDMTVAVWLNPERARTAGFALIVGKGTGGGGNVNVENRNYTLFLAPSAVGQPRFEFSINERDTDDNRHIQAGVIGARQWHLVVGVLRRGQMYLYCNGRLAADPLSINGPKTSDEPLLIGRSQHPQIQSPFQGAIDMIAILNRGMTDAEVQAMYLAGRP